MMNKLAVLLLFSGFLALQFYYTCGSSASTKNIKMPPPKSVDLPYEVESTLLELLAKKNLDKLDTSKRSVIPIYRKDLDPNYIAYYEIFVDRNHFYVLSSGPKTGDHRVAESGTSPLPTVVLREMARKDGQVCKKYYMLTSMGLYMCENAKGIAVAATYNWMTDSPFSDWTKIHKMVQKSLNDFKKEWEKMAVKTSEAWKTSQRHKANQKPNLKNYDAVIVSPGSSAKVALEKNHGKITIHAIPEKRQKELCAILENVCTKQANEVNQNLILKSKSGIKYLEFKVKQDDVKKILKNKKISFYFKVMTKDGGKIVKYFSVDPSTISQRSSYWSLWTTWKVQREDLFPEYNQHYYCCGCYTGSGPVAWASILAFYDRLAHHLPHSGYSKKFWSCSDSWYNGCMAPSKMNYYVKRYIEGIRKTLGTYCSLGVSKTKASSMKNILSWYRARGIGGRVFWSYHIVNGLGVTQPWIRQRAAGHIKLGYPAIVGVWIKGSNKNSMHYAVATRYAVRHRRYRVCSGYYCYTKWVYDRAFYLHMGWGGSSNGWYRLTPFAAFAARKH